MTLHLEPWKLATLTAVVAAVLLASTPSQPWYLTAFGWAGWGMCAASTIWVWRLDKDDDDGED